MDDFTPEQLKALIELGIIPEELAGVDSQIQQAQALRSSPMPQGQMAGNVYVAPSIAQFAAAGMDRYQGMKDMKGLQDKRQGLLDKTTAGRMSYAQALIDKLRGNGVQTYPVE